MKIFRNMQRVDTPFGVWEAWIWARWFLLSIGACLLYLPLLSLVSIPKILRYSPMFLTFWFCLVADLGLKIYYSEVLANGRVLEVVPGFMSLVLVHNKGAAFGLLQGFSWLFVAMAILTGAFILLYLSLYREEEPMVSWALVLILAGALGNMIDRVRWGYVTDYVLLYYQDFRWPVFNFADVAINIGVALIVLDMLLDLSPLRRKKEDSYVSGSD
jgi:signal peptidase II